MELSKEARKMVKAALVYGLVVIVVALIFRSRLILQDFFIGLALGMLASLARIFILERTVNAIANGAGQSRAMTDQVIRLAIALGALLIGALVDGVSLLGAALGVLAFSVGSYALRLDLRPKDKERLDKAKGEKEEEE